MKISDEYLQQQKQLHKDPKYGVASKEFAAMVRDLSDQAGAKSISDYGAGKCNLQKTLLELGKTNFEYYPFDPAFPEYGPPRKADLVCCIDVLEHIEPQFLDAVLDELRDITHKVGLFSIHTAPALKILPDGRNAHLIQKPVSWWLRKLCDRFEIAQLRRQTHGFWIIVDPLQPS